MKNKEKISYCHTEGIIELNWSCPCRDFIIILTANCTLIDDGSILHYLQQTSVLYYLFMGTGKRIRLVT